MLAPDPTLLKTTLTEHLNLHHQLKLKLHALSTLKLHPTPDASQTVLQQVKKDMLVGGLKLLPDFCMFTPRGFMDYTVQLERALKKLRPIMQEVVAHQGGIPTDTQRQTLLLEIQKLHKCSEQHQLKHQELKEQFQELLSPMRQHHLDLSMLLEDQLSAQGSEKHQIEHMQAQLQILIDKLRRDAAEATSSSIGFGTPVHGLTLRISFQNRGEAQPFSQFGVTVASLGAPLGSQLTPEVAEDLQWLNDGMQDLNLEQQLLVISHGTQDFLHGLLKTLRRASDHEAAQSYLWNINSRLLDALLDTLQQPQIRLQTIKLLHSLLSASHGWQAISEFALQSQSTTICLSEVVTLPPIMLGPSSSGPFAGGTGSALFYIRHRF